MSAPRTPGPDRTPLTDVAPAVATAALPGPPRRRSHPPQAILRSAFDRSPSGMTVFDLTGRWLEVNDAYCRLLGYGRAELLGLTYRDVTHRDDLLGDVSFIAAALEGNAPSLERDKRYVRGDGSTVWAHVRIELIRDEQGKPQFFLSHATDCTQRRAEQSLFNDTERTLRAVIDNTPALISVTGRDHRYKLVNREFERHFGVTSAWIIGRNDADILPPSTCDAVHARDLRVLNDGIRTQEEEAVEVRGHERVMLRTRFPLRDEKGEIQGVCTSSTDITERRAEEREKRERLQCSELVYSALAQGRLMLHCQPIIHLASQKPAKAELLVRMRKAGGSDELLAPAMFLPAAERFGLITAVDQWVVGQASELAAEGHSVTVNVSAKTISDSRHVERIEATVNASAAAGNLVFEITETAVADNLAAAHDFAVRMAGLGCGIALDDFGVGHGAFTYLRHLPVDYLKIDMQFVRNLLGSPADSRVIQAIIGVARQFEIETIAEGVEDQATLDELRRLGIDYGQGYWIGRLAPVGRRGHE
jgi:PAS domain S-box-containing protein